MEAFGVNETFKMYTNTLKYLILVRSVSELNSKNIYRSIIYSFNYACCETPKPELRP